MSGSSASPVRRVVVLAAVTVLTAACCLILADELWHQLDPGMPALRHTVILGVPFDTARFSVAGALHADLTLVVLTVALLVATVVSWTRTVRRRRA